jgi:ABC-type branched-subunit amino acid transport system substrate-binding protein
MEDGIRLLADDIEQGGSLARLAIDKLHTAAPFVVDDQSAYGSGLANEIEKVLKKKSINAPHVLIPKADDPPRQTMTNWSRIS